MQAAVARALRDVLATYPFQPGAQTVGPPASEADLVALRSRVPCVPDDLVAVCRWVGEVSLPDIANGYFMFGPQYIHDGRADRIGEPFAEDVDVVVFGSDGGGATYAMAVDGVGTVYRLDGCAHPGVTGVVDDLDDFLERLLAAVEAFADDGQISGL
nr:hypothetical protein GCM10020063_001660 [Dactylosporangium thailandense]